MDALVFFGLPGAAVGFVCGAVLRSRLIASVVVVALVTALIVGLIGTTASGETDGGWLGFIVAGFQLAAFLIGMVLGILVKRLRGRRHSPATN